MSACEQASSVVRVLDNASEDDTEEVVADLQRSMSNIIYTRREFNIGAAANFADSVTHVDTPYFTLLSDDDYLLPGFYAKAMAELEATPEAMFWVGCTLNCDESGRIWDARVLGWPRDGLYMPPEGAFRMCHGLAPTWTGIVFRTEVLRASGFIDARILGPADLDFTLRLGCRHPFILRRDPVAVFTLNPQAFTATEPLSSFWPGWKQMLANVASESALAPEARSDLVRALTVDACRMLFRRGLNAVASHRPEFARDAAETLRAEFGRTPQYWMLEAARRLASFSAGQSVATAVYRRLERRILSQRAGLQREFGHLLRSVDQ